MPSQLKTLVVVATTCTLVGLIVTYTVGQSEQRRAENDRANWRTESDPIEVDPNAPDDVGDDAQSPARSAAFWNSEMGETPRRLYADDTAETDGLDKRDAGQETVAARMQPVGGDDRSPATALEDFATAAPPQDPFAARNSAELSNEASEFLTTLQDLEAQLQRLGASYYRLESSEDGSEFHFHCEMPLAEQPGFHRFFDAKAASPEESIKRVIGAVEQWLVSREGR